MSYDIRFAVKVDGMKNGYAVIGQPEHRSPTYNVGNIFRESMGWDFRQSTWYPLNEVVPMVEKGIHEMQFNSKAYKHLEPDNGWGSTDTVLNALNSIMKWIVEDLRNSWNSDIPLSCIYMSW